MLIKLKKRMAQTTLEYAVLAVVVIGALLSIQAYLRRGISGKLKTSTDDISGEQYDNKKTTYNKVTKTNTRTRERTTQCATLTNTLYENTTINALSTTNTSGDYSGN